MGFRRRDGNPVDSRLAGSPSSGSSGGSSVFRETQHESIGLLGIWELLEGAALGFGSLGMNPVSCWEQAGLGGWE